MYSSLKAPKTCAIQLAMNAVCLMEVKSESLENHLSKKENFHKTSPNYRKCWKCHGCSPSRDPHTTQYRSKSPN